MSPPRVAMFVNTLRPGGTERNVAMLCKHMDKRRFQPEVWTLLPGGEHEATVRSAGVPVHCLHRGRSFSPRFAWRAGRAIARCDADLFHAFLPAITFYVGVAKGCFGARAPLAYSEATTLVGRRWMLPLQRWILRRHCAAFAANSISSQAFLASQGIPLDRIRLIPNGHEVDCFHQPFQRDAVRRQLGLDPADRLALFVGRLVPTKRVCDLIEAVRMVDPARYRLRVAIVGDGPELEALQTLVRQAGLERVVEFLGMRSDVVSLLRAADLFVFPSEIEGLSNAVIEAALAGLPIVGCDVGGVRDIVDNEVEALLVPPRQPQAFAASLGGILDNLEWARSMGEAARRRAEQAYAVENTLQKLYALYDQILAAGS